MFGLFNLIFKFLDQNVFKNQFTSFRYLHVTQQTPSNLLHMDNQIATDFMSQVTFEKIIDKINVYILLQKQKKK